MGKSGWCLTGQHDECPYPGCDCTCGHERRPPALDPTVKELLTTCVGLEWEDLTPRQQEVFERIMEEGGFTFSSN